MNSGTPGWYPGTVDGPSTRSIEPITGRSCLDETGMVEDRITDGQRIAELLAAELDGRTDRGLDRVAVVETAGDGPPASRGERAYAVTTDAERLATIRIHPDRVRLTVHVRSERVRAAASEAGLQVTGGPDGPVSVCIENGAAVKRLIDVIAAVLPR